MVVAALLVLVSGIVLVACLQNAREQGWTAPGLSALRRTRTLPAPPPEDAPPPGLSPLIPTQRAITTEFERGLRELTLFLAVQPND